MQEIVCIIPAFNPDQKLLDLVDQLHEFDFWRIVVVNDGSQNQCHSLFEQVEKRKCVVLSHDKNRGKGEALKTAFEYISRVYPNTGCISIDCDGQHTVQDVQNLVSFSHFHPGELILGVRDFSGKDVPFRSRLGNGIMSFIFRVNHHFKCPDTQTGLRLIPENLIPLALKTEGSRYEYEMNFLNNAARQTKFQYVPIQTVYENNNEGSHFRPVRDSIIILKRLLRFSLSSLASTGVDFILFSLLWVLLPFRAVPKTWIATILARCASGLCNYTLNRYWAFESGQSGSFIRYVLLWAAQMLCSAFLTSWLQVLLPVLAAKILADGFLFIMSYRLQKDWVFRKGVLI